MREKIKEYWQYIQELLTVDGGLYVDAMCIAVILRLLGPLFKFPPMTASEAALWGTTIATFGYSKGGKS